MAAKNVFERLEMAKEIVATGRPHTETNRRRIISVLDEAFMVLIECEQLAARATVAETVPPLAVKLAKRLRRRI